MNEHELEHWNGIMHDFARLPQTNKERTMLEICRYPRNRFEEVCSRILAFFLDPNAEHGLADLWVTALLEAVGRPELHDYRQDVSVRTEEWADGKRIDLIVEADDYVVVIENKITASVYNPLDVYKEYVERTYRDKKAVLLVLSMKPLLDLRNIMGNDFKRCSYGDLFAAVNRHIGDYILNANQKYTTLMFDFIKTINNMSNLKSTAEQEFFGKNRAEIEKMIERYNQFRADMGAIQAEQVALLKEMVAKSTNSGDWWVWEGGDLGFSFNNDTHRIGIESWFIDEGGNPCARYYICVTTWKTADWEPYKEAVTSRFAGDYDIQEEYRGKRVYLHLTDSIPGNDSQQIIEKLTDVYNRMKEITDEIK